MQIRLLTLGTLRCFLGDAELADLPAQRLRCAVLLYLALEREATREAVASLLWPERDSERGRHALSQKLYELRQILGEDWVQAPGERMRVTPLIRVDMHEFETAVQRGALEEALALYNGEFLGDFYVPGSKNFENWVDRHRARVARLHRKTRRELIDQCVARGDVERAMLAARRWVELEPLEDEAHHRLIELLAHSGNRAEAIRQYDSYERALKAEELEPLEQTRALIAVVRQSSTAPTPPTAAPAAIYEPSESVESASLPAAVQPRVPASRRRRVIAVAIAAALLLAVGSWAARHYLLRASTPSRSIAVLPFLNLSTDPSASEHLSDGVAEELIHALSQTDSLRVAARTSSFRFRGKDVSIRTVGDSLDVELVLEGSVRQEGSRLRVAAQLIKVSDGYHLWSGKFDRELKDVLTLQEEIAGAIVDALRIRLASRGPARLAVGGTANTQAYQAYLRGRYLLHKGTRDAVLSSMEYLDSAVALDPRYALAYAALAQAHLLVTPSRERRAETAKAAAERAVQLAPRLSEAHAALGRAELERWAWDAAEREAKLAIQLDWRNSSAHATYAGVLMVRGRTEEAVREATLAAQLEPLSAAAAADYAEALRAARKYHLAVQIHRRALELEPTLGRQNLAKVYIELAMYDSALAQFRTAVTAGAPHLRRIDLLWIAYTYARAGKRDQAMDLLGEFERQPPQAMNGYMLAALHLALGNRERAFQLLERGISEWRAAAWRQLPWDPVWDPVRQDPRFARLMRQMNL
ncbi:MAG: hypothetical protein HY703_03705 [Gemmatimonadetes bacterium]|nr:hypothetical protein [Gemmatimonadota bacterium]